MNIDKLINDCITKFSELKKKFFINDPYFLGFLEKLNIEKDQSFNNFFSLEKSLKEAINTQLLGIKDIINSNMANGYKNFLIIISLFIFLDNTFRWIKLIETIKEQTLESDNKYKSGNEWKKWEKKYKIFEKIHRMRNMINHNFSYYLGGEENREVFWEITQDDDFIRFGNYKSTDKYDGSFTFNHFECFSINPELFEVFLIINSELDNMLK